MLKHSVWTSVSGSSRVSAIFFTTQCRHS